MWSIAGLSHNFLEEVVAPSKYLLEHVTVHQALICYGNPNNTSQHVPKFLCICPISMAQFQEKFISSWGIKTSAHVSVRTHYFASDRRWGESLREKNPFSSALRKILDLTAVGLLHTQPMPVTVARKASCALNNQGPPPKLIYQW